MDHAAHGGSGLGIAARRRPHSTDSVPVPIQLTSATCSGVGTVPVPLACAN